MENAHPPPPAFAPEELDSRPAPRSCTSATVTSTLAVIAALWWGQRFLVPLTGGIVLAMLVMPLNVRLQAWLRSPMAATAITLALVLGSLGVAAMAFGGQLLRVAERVPEMISMAAQQLAARDPGTDSVLMRARDALQELDHAADRLMGLKPPTRPGRRATTITVSTPASTAPNGTITTGATVALRETAVTGSSALLGFAGKLSIIFFIAFFVLTGGKALTERFLDLWSYHPAAYERARQATLECARQIRLYAGVLLVTNIIIGIVVWLAFWAADLPDAAGWGATAAILHVVPYLGMAVLTGLGAAEAFLAHETVGAALGMGTFLVAMSTVVGTLMAAWLQGRAARMNPAAVFIGLVFWGAMWGLWGLFLGPALVVMFKVVAEHSAAGQPLARLMQG